MPRTLPMWQSKVMHALACNTVRPNSRPAHFNEQEPHTENAGVTLQSPCYFCCKPGECVPRLPI